MARTLRTIVDALVPRQHPPRVASFHDAVSRILDAGAYHIIWRPLDGSDSDAATSWECTAEVAGVRWHGWGPTGFDAARDLAEALEGRLRHT